MMKSSLIPVKAISFIALLVTGAWICWGCTPPKAVRAILPTDTPSPSPSSTITSSPTSTLTATPTLTSIPEPTETPQSYCTELAINYSPPIGYQLFCDSQFEHALVFPLDWETKVGVSNPFRGNNSLLILKGQDFYNYDVSNDIRLETWRNAQALSDLVERQKNIMECKDQCFTSSVKLGGETGYVLIVPSLPQSYDVLFTFFKWGDYFSQLVLMINTKAGLDVYWQMVQSLQFPGTTPAENEIPAEVINESYKHVGNSS